MTTKKAAETLVLLTEIDADQVKGEAFAGEVIAEDPRGDLEKRARGTKTTLDLAEGLQSKTPG